ncbi:MAG: N-acetylmuramoyl-L-alanine amidase [Bacteroidota bacterium]
MGKKYRLLVGIIISMGCYDIQAQSNVNQDDQLAFEQAITKNVESHIYQSYTHCKLAFDKAYLSNPEIPRGILEAVSFNYTRFTHRKFDKATDDAGIGMPRTYGVMGLTLDGQNYFRNNLKKISSISEISVAKIISNPNDNVMAYAKAFSKIAHIKKIKGSSLEKYIPVLIDLCELPLTSDVQNNYAMNTFLYGIFDFLNNQTYSKQFNFPNYHIDLKQIFGQNYKVLSSSFVKIENNMISTKDNNHYIPAESALNKSTKNTESTDYGPAIWNAAATCNYTVGRTSTISAIAVHYTAGSYAGSISWFQNCAAQASAHYCLRSSDGQVTQMVRESDKAWHVRNENPYTIGFEHEAIEPVQNYFTVAMYQSSAALIRDICASGYGISPLRMFYRDTLDDGTVLDYGIHSLGAEGSCTKIKGHQHFPDNTHTDPGPYWNWDYYFKQVNNTTTTTTYNTPTGVFTDDGGSTANYSIDNRKLYLIEVPNASHITLNFTQFALESNYDFMYIYDGNSVYSPKIGRYNTISPGTITSSGNQLLIEFRSDCATTAAGWVANWTSVSPDNIAPTTIINQADSLWVTADYTANFTDADNASGSGLDRRFYQVMYQNGSEWTSNQNRGFAVDNFDSYNTSKWKIPSGNVSWSVANAMLQVLDTNTDNSNIYSLMNGSLSNSYLYDFYAKIDGASTNKRFGFHFACDSATLTNRGNSYFIYIRPGTSQLEFYKVINNVFTQVKIVTGVVTNLNQFYHYKIVHDRVAGKIEVFRDDVFISEWTDATPLTTPSNAFSFRTARTQMWVKLMRVYRTRAATSVITVGTNSDDDIQLQSTNSSLVAKVKSLVVDNTKNYSLLMSKEMKVDWTKPSTVSVIDGSSGDLDVFGTQGIIRGSWSNSIDTNSGIQKYRYAIGTSIGASNIVGWTDNGVLTTFAKSGLTLVDGTTYYIMVKSQNGAGLWSDSTSSDGAVFHLLPIADFNANTQNICTGSTVQYTNLSANTTGQTWYFQGGNPAVTSTLNPLVSYASPGNYTVKLVVNGAVGADSVTRIGYVSVQNSPSIPSIVTNPTICEGGNAQIVISGSSTLVWYENSLGGTILTTGTTYNTGVLTQPKTYYVRSEIGSCMSNMLPITVAVESMPAMPQLTATVAICSGSTDTLTATGTSQIVWYNTNAADNVLGFGGSIITSALTQNTIFYARIETANCKTALSNVTVVVKPIPDIPDVFPTQNICYGESTQLSATGTQQIVWYNSALGITPLFSGENYSTPNLTSASTYYVRSELNGCNSAFATIDITIYNLPNQPTITFQSPNQLCSSSSTGNQWYFSGMIMDSIVNQCINPIENGYYSVQVVNENGCFSAFSDSIYYSTVSVNDAFDNDFVKISPNPVISNFTISFGNTSGLYSIRLYDEIGQLIEHESVEVTAQKTIQINLSERCNGIYYLMIDGNSVRFSKSLIKVAR